MSALEAQEVDEAVIDAMVDSLRAMPAEVDSVDEESFDEDGFDEDGFDEEEDILLEPSETLEIEAVRHGLALLADTEREDEDELLLDEPSAEEDEHEIEEEPPVEAEAEAAEEPPVETEADDAEEPECEAGEPRVSYFDTVARAAAADKTEAPEELEVEVELADAEAAAFLDEVFDQPEFEATMFDPEHEVAANVDPLKVPAWNKLNISAYSFARGLRGMAQSPLVQLLAVGTMAVCMLLLGTTTLIFQNAQQVANDLGVDKPVTVYMAPGVDEQTAAELRNKIAALPEVDSATRVSPEEALARLQVGLGTTETTTVDRGDLLAGIEAELLPESVEVALVPGVEPGFADALAGQVQTMDGVEEVSVLGPWVQEVERMLSTLRWLALGVGGLVSLACLAIVWSTIRLGVFARRSEIQILRLVGGTHRFVRGPFVVEGVVQGVLGTALALAGLWLAFDLIRPFLERGMSLLFAAGSLHFFTTLQLGLALGFGALLGLIGSRAAVARYAEG